MNIYLHTLNGQPGVFNGEQVCYCTQTYGNCREPAYSLEQIRREQRASVRWRKSKGFETHEDKMSYVRYEIREEHSRG